MIPELPQVLMNVDARIGRTFASKSLDKYARALLRTLSENHRGAATAVTAKELAGSLHLEWCEGARRKICDAVAALRHAPYCIPIGSSRGEREARDSIRKATPQGYFLIVNARELASFNKVYQEQAVTSIELLYEMNGIEFVRALLGKTLQELEAKAAA